jgi:hypothetical protein
VVLSRGGRDAASAIAVARVSQRDARVFDAARGISMLFLAFLDE